MITLLVIEFHIIRIHAGHCEVAVGVVVSVGFGEPIWVRVSEPPLAVVRSLPRTLLVDLAVHGVLCASTATVLIAGYVYDQVGLRRVSIDVSARVACELVVHGSPILFVAWGPNLPPARAGVLLSALGYTVPVGNSQESTSRVSRYWDRLALAVFWAPRKASCRRACRGHESQNKRSDENVYHAHGHAGLITNAGIYGQSQINSKISNLTNEAQEQITIHSTPMDLNLTERDCKRGSWKRSKKSLPPTPPG